MEFNRHSKGIPKEYQRNTKEYQGIPKEYQRDHQAGLEDEDHQVGLEDGDHQVGLKDGDPSCCTPQLGKGR